MSKNNPDRKTMRLLAAMMLLLNVTEARSQNAEMADTLRQDGKIYVVIGVIVLIFICLAAFMAYLERRISRAEKRLGKGDNK